MSSFSSLLIKRWFSDKKPYPGCTASALVCLQAEIILSIDKYDSDEGAGPILTASSASFTCNALSSASE